MHHKNSLTRAENKTEDLLQSVLEAGSSGLDGIRGLVREQFASKVHRRSFAKSKIQTRLKRL